jgi:hypothetical protein
MILIVANIGTGETGPSASGIKRLDPSPRRLAELC